MSIFNAAINRNQTGLAKKEDLVPISVKITKKYPFYDWTMYHVQFKNNDTNYWVRWNIPFSKADMKVENILPILEQHGLDTKKVSKDGWKDLVKGAGLYQNLFDWRSEQEKVAEQEGTKEKNRWLDYTYTSKKLSRGSNYLVTVTMRMYGGWRSFKYVFNYNEYLWEYEDDKTGKIRHTPISEALNYDVEGLMDDITHTSLTEEEWKDDSNFKELYDQARATIKRYKSGC